MENVNVDETKVGKFLYEVVRYAMENDNNLTELSILLCAQKVNLMSINELHAYVVREIGKSGSDKDSEHRLKQILVELELDSEEKIGRWTDELVKNLDNWEAFNKNLNEKITVLNTITKYVCSEGGKEGGKVFSIKPDYFFNIIDIDEFRFARKQALEAQKSATNAYKLTFWSLLVSSIIGGISIYIALTNPVSIDSKQNKVAIESKQIDKIQEKMDNMSRLVSI